MTETSKLFVAAEFWATTLTDRVEPDVALKVNDVCGQVVRFGEMQTSPDVGWPCAGWGRLVVPIMLRSDRIKIRISERCFFNCLSLLASEFDMFEC